MGAADVVPGVSGGTIAFITGIYERLLAAISAVNPSTFKLLLKRDWKGFFAAIDIGFLVSLLLGIGTAIISLAKLITYLLENQEILLWSFFFGLIVASSILVLKQVKRWSIGPGLMLVIGVLLAWYLTSMNLVSLPQNLLGTFIAGFVAIIAMILPGISGSYILLMLGKYEEIIGLITQLASKDLSVLPQLMVFGIGCVSGLLVFARVLKWLLNHYHDLMVAMLTGFMIGSLNKVWPWKHTISTFVNRHGEVKPLLQENILPEAFDIQFVMALALAVAAVLLVLGLESLGKKYQKANV